MFSIPIRAENGQQQRAFGIFRRDLLLKIGAFRAGAVGEDFDLIVRLHRYLDDLGVDYHIQFFPDPTCWREAPSDYKSLVRQRARWHKGLLDTLSENPGHAFPHALRTRRLDHPAAYVAV
jgi:cellulose synthase/poly-beta-1,6-N-acetylglucosamine synthase-like glycosyltransferase